MDIAEVDLPGVGKRFELTLRSNRTAIIVIHNNGRREIFFRDDPDDDAEEVFKMTDREARVFGTILEGAYFQPIRTDIPETLLGDDVLLEWYKLDEEEPLVGKSMEEADIRSQSGVTIIAVERGGEVHTNPDINFTLQSGDTLVTVGSREEHETFASIFSV